MVVANDHRTLPAAVEASTCLYGIQAVIIPALSHHMLHDTGCLTQWSGCTRGWRSRTGNNNDLEVSCGLAVKKEAKHEHYL